MEMNDGKIISEFFYGANIDDSILRKSSSGGVFSACAKVILKLGGIVIGAVYNEEKYLVEHIAVDTYEAIDRMRKSKYVWSDFTRSIKDIQKAIIEKRYVLFTGTPCQAAAIQKKFGYYDKLYVLDLFCHGTAEPNFFKAYLESLDYKIKEIDFRFEGKEDNYNFKYVSNDECNQEIISSWNENIFTRLYMESVVMRNVCFKCKYCEKKHVSDLTIGDFDYKDYARENGIMAKHPSIITINTPKGKYLWQTIRGEIKHRKLLKEEMIKSYFQNHSSGGVWGYNWDRKKEFEELVQNEGFEKAAIKTCYPREMVLLEKLIGKTVYLYGAGKISKRIISIKNKYFKNDINVEGIIVTERIAERSIYGIPVNILSEIDFNNINKVMVVLAVGDKFQDEIYKKLNSITKEINVIKY
ncbi:Coenzyme F420 hydrogenase/dehydrogenase, beta subunit N-term [Pseudobutyrivibrio sp. NOR37]|uniref:Coenzyme F420 hydrogenase/dehydrogenase beta subunit C-terminal domain-containing protein n=1 Tax=Pseudobutyrivibrio xylanivorans TaxID=185007 RepID=A0A6M0LH33_PSEXY|nr:MULTISPECIES: Coenzyme F420 hydrogenase/dehydrogenase, beta subunit C-terminal domain [Pseudobutyrivibrio]NEX01864.1 hypothetical protein [Pseudobutyrivibrio xylanivorans]SFR72350.1 Coenzyme F420 hydrogenase/dehydrogenase, beta subunit N-term [Pseudobutyrivibrio sp. NOR37]